MDWLYSAADLEQAVLKTGFLPFFQSDIPEFSIEEFTPAEYWFADGVDGPWEWKSPVAGNAPMVNCFGAKRVSSVWNGLRSWWIIAAPLIHSMPILRINPGLSTIRLSATNHCFQKKSKHYAVSANPAAGISTLPLRGSFMKNKNSCGNDRKPDSRRLSPVCKWERGLSWRLSNTNTTSTAILMAGVLPVTLRPKLCSGKIGYSLAKGTRLKNRKCD